MPTYPPTSTSLSAQTPVTSSIVPPIRVPTYGDFGTFSILVKTLISTPQTGGVKLNPFDVIRDTKTWKEWNTFCPGCTFTPPSEDGILQIDSVISIDVHMSGNGLVPGAKKDRGSSEIVTRVEEFNDGHDAESRRGWRLAWKATDYPQWLLRCERVLEFVETEDGWEYTGWETFGGAMALVLKWTVGPTLVDRLGDYGRDIKDFIEKNEGGGVVNNN